MQRRVNSKAKQISDNACTKNSNNCYQLLSQLGQAKSALRWLSKKVFSSYYKINQGQNSNTQAIDVNTRIIKKRKKIQLDLCQILYYNYYKKKYYTNKCLDKV